MTPRLTGSWCSTRPLSPPLLPPPPSLLPPSPAAPFDGEAIAQGVSGAAEEPSLGLVVVVMLCVALGVVLVAAVSTGERVRARARGRTHSARFPITRAPEAATPVRRNTAAAHGTAARR